MSDCICYQATLNVNKNDDETWDSVWRKIKEELIDYQLLVLKGVLFEDYHGAVFVVCATCCKTNWIQILPKQ